MSACPFECGWILTQQDPYKVMLHVETEHPEFDESPFAADGSDASLALARQLQQDVERLLRDNKLDKGSYSSLAPTQSSHKDNVNHKPALRKVSTDVEVDFVECILCSEIVYLSDYNDHLNIHASLDDTVSSHTIAKMTESDSGYETDPRPSPLTDSNDTHHSQAEKRKRETTLSRTAAHVAEQSTEAGSNSSSGVRLGVSIVSLFTQIL